MPLRTKEPSEQSSVVPFTSSVRLAVAIDVIVPPETQVALVLNGLGELKGSRSELTDEWKLVCPRLRHPNVLPFTVQVQAETAPRQSSPLDSDMLTPAITN